MGSKPNIRELKERKDFKGLVRALEHDDSRVRSEAVKALSEVGGASAVPLLVNAIGSMRNDSSRSAAVRSLTGIGEPAVMPLVQTLGNKSETVLFGVIEALGRIGDRRAVEPLGRLVREHREYHYVRREAVSALGKLGEEAADAVAPALRDENFLVRQEAVKALGNIGGGRAAGILVQSLQYGESADNVAEIRRAINRIKGSAAKEIKGACPVCGTSLGFWDASPVKCHFCGVNLNVEHGKLVEQTPAAVVDSPEEKAVIYLHRGASTGVVWPNCCCLCLAAVTASDYYKISASHVLSFTAVAGRMEQKLLEYATEVPYCKGCRRKVKKVLGRSEQEAVSAEVTTVGMLDNVRLTFKFRNPRYAQMFRQANKDLIREGKQVAI